MAEENGEKSTRSESLLATRQQKMDETFKGKKFEVVKEIHLEGEERFQTPFGNKGRHGFALREVGNPSNTFVVGESMLTLVDSEYGAITEMPVKERKRRTAEQKAEDDAREAEEKAARKVEKERIREEKAAAKEAEKQAKAQAKAAAGAQ